MAGIIPLTSQVPAKAPTSISMIIGLYTLLRFSITSLIITPIETLLNSPTTIATTPPINRIYWFE